MANTNSNAPAACKDTLSRRKLLCALPVAAIAMVAGHAATKADPVTVEYERGIHSTLINHTTRQAWVIVDPGTPKAEVERMKRQARAELGL